MVYTILIAVVFIAELIITVAVIQYLLRLDRFVLDCNETLLDIKANINDITVLGRKISEQWVLLANGFTENVQKKTEDVALKYLSKLLLSILLVKFNFKLVKKIRQSKVTKIFLKGWSFFENMV